MPRIVTVGSANCDLVCRAERLPAPGETILGGQFFQAAGGKGANQAVAAARLGGQVTFVARLGRDDYGDRAIAGYQADGLDTRFIARDDEAPSGVALILVDQTGENSIVVAPGANARLTADDVAAAGDAFTGAQVVLCQLEVPLEAVATAVRLGRQAGATVILNPAPARPLPRELLAGVDILVPNETEARLLGAEESTLDRLGVPTVVLTRGARGALLVSGGERLAVAAPLVEAVDTTAAGDAFCGALAVAVAEGRPLAEAVGRACAAGALAATVAGAQPSLPTLAQLESLLGRAA